MAKFNVGDKVRILASSGVHGKPWIDGMERYLSEGQGVTVHGEQDDSLYGQCYSVRTVDDVENDRRGWWVRESSLAALAS